MVFREREPYNNELKLLCIKSLCEQGDIELFMLLLMLASYLRNPKYLKSRL